MKSHKTAFFGGKWELDIIERLFYNKNEVIDVDVREYWEAVLGQDARRMTAFFWEDGVINWHNTNERVTVPEFIRANCDYPGQWDGKVERIIELSEEVITVTCVYDREKIMSFHVVSFIRIKNGRIQSIDEYWGDDNEPPQWRQELHIGSQIE